MKSLPRGEGFRVGVTWEIWFFGLWAVRHKNKEALSLSTQGFQRTAATYSPNWWVSTIGDGELNFSVRNGKRWFLTAITAAI